MRSLLATIILVLGSAGVPACTADVHDNTINIPNAKVDVTANTDVNNVKPGDAVPMHVNATGVFLIEPGATPPPEHVNDAGHLELFLDSTDSKSILVTAQIDVKVTVATDTQPGNR